MREGTGRRNAQRKRRVVGIFEKGTAMDKIGFGAGILVVFLVGLSIGMTVQERQDAKGIRKAQEQLEDMLYDLQHKKYVEIPIEIPTEES